SVVVVSWSVTNTPAGGLPDITFPLTIVEADHIVGYHFGQQFSFVTSGIAYIGLHPRPDSSGKPVVRGIFSNYIPDSTTSDKNCHRSADGGAAGDVAVLCAVDWAGVYNRTYDLEVISGENQTWIGTVIDTVTGARTHIGSFTLTRPGGGIGNQAGFVEWYPWISDHCARLPYQKTIFGNPRTTHAGSVGVQKLPSQDGDCTGKANFHAERVVGGVVNSCGFRGMSGRL
ncbi:hypothetical protein DFH09DRAFT_1489426, partial [Mycena vulgaris]